MEGLYGQPALETPPGVVSHFPDTSSSSQIISYPIAVFVLLVPGVLFAIRIYTKLFILGGLDTTDITLSLAWPLFITIVALGFPIAANGGGAHQWNLRNADLIHMLHYTWLYEIVFGPCMFLVKTTILLQYQRLFSPRRSQQPFMWWSTNVLILAIGIYYSVGMFTTIFACIPLEAAYNYLLTGAKCIGENTTVFTTCIFNMITDVLILVLPIRTVSKLQMPNRKRVGIIALFTPGILACVCRGMVIYYYFKVVETKDQSYYFRAIGCWEYAEMSFGFIVSSAITLPKFFKAKFPIFNKYWSRFSRWFTTLKARMSSNSREETAKMHPSSGTDSSGDRKKPTLPEIQHVKTMTFASKIGGTDYERTRVTIDTVSDIEDV